ncbi:MAG: cupredoxin domain-containing protein, partial [Thermomicrobiales bacterium]
MVKRLLSVAILAFVAMMALSACGSEEEAANPTVTRNPNAANVPVAGSPTAPGAANQTAAKEVTLKMVDIAFDPKNFTIAANTDVVIHLENDGASLHNFSVDSLKISEDVEAGGKKDVTIKTGPGDLDYYCDVPGHKQAGMEGTITVAAPGAAPQGGASPAAAGSPSPGVSPFPAASPGPGASPPAAAGGLTIELQDILFAPSSFSLPANTATKVSLKNT